MYDHVREFAIIFQKSIPDHDQVLWVLVIDGTGRIDACLDIGEAIVNDDQ